jgi:hypothetical protein
MYVISNSDEKIQFDETFPKWAKLISEMLEDTDKECKESKEEIPIPFDTDTIKLCIKFCKLYDQDPFSVSEESITTTNIRHFFPKWCIDLLDINPVKIFELMKLSNFIDIDVLIVITCIKISLLMKGGSSEEIRSVLYISKEEEKENFVHKWIKAHSI